MGRDTIRLEDVVSTISHEYLLEFTSEYGIPESLHPELPRPKDPIVEFLERKSLPNLPFTTVNDRRRQNFFSLISAPNLTKVKTGTHPRVTHEVPLLTATVSHVIDMEDTAVASGSSRIPSALENSPLDFVNEDPPKIITEGGEAATTEVILELSLEKEVAAIGPPMNKRHRKRGKDEAEANAPSKVLTKDHAAFRPAQGTLEGKSLAPIGLDAGSTIATPATHDAPTAVSDPDPLSYAKPQPHPERDIAQEIDLLPLRGRVTRRYLLAGVRRDQQLPPGYPKRMPRHGGSHSGDGFSNKAKIQKRGQIAEESQRQDSQTGLEDASEGGRETLLEAEVDIKKAAEAKNAKLTKELESLRVPFSDLQRCAEMDARLDKLSVDFDEELYPHMLTAIAGHRWVIGHDLRLAVMKCAESLELRQTFADVVSAGLVKGMSEGLRHGIEHGRVGRDLAAIEAYNPEADSKYVKALQDLKDLRYPLVDQLKKLKDAPMDLIMSSLYLESNIREYAPSGSVTFALAPPN
nr:hypothetical protein [Tanacetum cinerariifolium]